MSRTVRPIRPGIEQVAVLAGVSRATVSRVLNGKSTVDESLRRRVTVAVEQLGYEPNPAARALVSRRTNTLALVASEPDVRVFGDPFFAGIVRGVTTEASAAGLQVALLMPHTSAELDQVERYVRSGAADGVLLISEHSTYDPLPRALATAGVPLVIGGRPLAGQPQVPYVDNDNIDGARLAARRLVEIGRRRIGTVTGPADMSAGIDRLEGFRLELGAAFDGHLVEHGDFTQAGGEAAASRLLARAPDIDALFAASDLTAFGAMRAIRSSGRRIPQDVAIVGFDDIDLAASTEPPLTTVRQQTILQGRAMVRLLLARTRPELALNELEGIPDLSDVDHLVLSVGLVIRDSG